MLSTHHPSSHATHTQPSPPRRLAPQAIDELKTKLDALTLPVDAATLQASAAELIGSARRTVRRRSFGDGAASEKGGGSLFEREGEAAVRASMDANFKASHEVCEVLWGKCSSSLASLKLATLPSRRRFTARVASCNATMVSCTGPAAAGYDARLGEAVAAGRVEYGEAFFAKLSHLLILTCFGGILFFRYVYAFALGELACWFVLLSVEVLPRLVSVTQFSSVPATFWESPAGAAALAYYEAIVYNECAALDSIGAARIPLPPRHRLPSDRPPRALPSQVRRPRRLALRAARRARRCRRATLLLQMRLVLSRLLLRQGPPRPQGGALAPLREASSRRARARARATAPRRRRRRRRRRR